MTNETIERFWSKVDIRGPWECWLWSAGKDGDGYGAFKDLRKQFKAHRVSFFIWHGRWPEPMCLHICDVPACVNPCHLFEGTPKDNSHDMHRKGRNKQASGNNHGLRKHPERAARGDANGASKLNDWQVIAIMARCLQGIPQRVIANEHSVSQSIVSRIFRGEIWKHLFSPR